RNGEETTGKPKSNIGLKNGTDKLLGSKLK
ncbi:unnamed protein product, partial [marine sediment metagenome]